MYAWLRIPDGFEDWAWVRTVLDEASVVVTPGLAFGPGGAGFFRISFVQPGPVLADAVARIAQVAVGAAAAGVA
jgi:aspartate/methionine/tyrosine aminotransferase